MQHTHDLTGVGGKFEGNIEYRVVKTEMNIEYRESEKRAEKEKEKKKTRQENSNVHIVIHPLAFH